MTMNNAQIEDAFQIYIWISVGVLGLYILYLPVYIYFRIKALKSEEKSFSLAFEWAVKKTIFSFLSNLTQESTETQSPHRVTTVRTFETDEDDPLSKNNGAIICDCYECFCDGWPWQISSDWSLFKWINKHYNHYRQRQLRLLKYSTFVVLECFSFLYLPINNLFYFCNNTSVMIVFCLILQTMNFLTNCFAVSFISTKREIVRLDRYDEQQRSLLMYYHFKKSWIFGLLTLGVMLTFTFQITESVEDEDENSQNPQIPHSPQNMFIICNSCYQFISYLILTLIARYNACLKSDLIQDNDKILQAQQSLYALQNNLTKYFPTEEATQMNPELVNEAKEHLDKSLIAINTQSFKKIKKNLGVKKCQIYTLILYLYTNMIVMTLVSILIYLCNSDTVDQIQKYFNFQSLYVTYFILNILQFTLFPLLVRYMYNKRALFGQDYGEWHIN